MYKTIEIRALDEWKLGDLGLAPLLRTLSARPKYLTFIRDIRVCAQLHRNLEARCLHGNEREYEMAHEEDIEDSDSEYSRESDSEDEAGDEVDDGDKKLTLSDLGGRVLSLLCLLQNNSLRSFS